MEGLILFNKPRGYFSTQIVNYFRKLTGKKVGHGGALDPLASGLLIIGIDDATKELTKFLKESKKTYVAEIILGYTSTTYDADGKIMATNRPLPSLKEIKKVIPIFLGKIKQKPPLYSSIKIHGKRAYELTRKGIEIELEEREIEIYNIEILDFKSPCLIIKTEVSSGTYIRSLTNDIGQKLGCGAYLNSLTRIKIDDFFLEEALSFNDIQNDRLELVAKIYGQVQGVGFKLFIKSIAKNLKIFGYVEKLTDDTVKVLAQGELRKLQLLINYLRRGLRLYKMESIKILYKKIVEQFSEFRVR